MGCSPRPTTSWPGPPHTFEKTELRVGSEITVALNWEETAGKAGRSPVIFKLNSTSVHTGVGEDALGDVKVNSGEAKPQQATGSPTKLRALFRAVGVVIQSCGRRQQQGESGKRAEPGGAEQVEGARCGVGR